MDIYYTNKTLYVNMVDEVDSDSVLNLRNKVFRILDDYNISNIVLSIISNTDSSLLDDFIKEYYDKYNGKIIIKK